MKLWTVKNLEDLKYDLIPFTGAWLDAFGQPERTGNWIIYGKSGQGKSTFALQLAKEFDELGFAVLFLSLEMGGCSDFQTDVRNVGITSGNSKMKFADSCTIEELEELLSKQRSPDVIFIDSIQYFEKQCGATSEDIIKMRKRYPKKIFVFISHVDGREVEGKTAYDVKRDSFKRILVEGFQATYIGRGKGGRTGRFIIWDNGYRSYWLETNNNNEHNQEQDFEKDD